MNKKGSRTVRNEPGQAWEMVWNELKRGGNFKGQSGPWKPTSVGAKCSDGIQQLQEAKLPASEIRQHRLAPASHHSRREHVLAPGDILPHVGKIRNLQEVETPRWA